LCREAAKVGLAAGAPALVLPALVGYAAVLARRGDPSGALRILGFVTAHSANRADTQGEVDRVRRWIGEHLSEEGLTEGMDAGRSLSLDACVADLLKKG
jgi:hypothetical protein